MYGRITFVKTSIFPALRVRPELREAAERALLPDETLSRFMEASLESYIAHRAAEQDFITRGLRSADSARNSQRYVSAGAVLAKLDRRLAKARAAAPRASPAGRKRPAGRK
jgi:predicted transcriptional regulator